MANRGGPLADSLAEDIESFERGDIPAGWSRVDSSVNARVYRDGSRSLYFKIFLPRDRWDKIKSWVRGDRSVRARASTEYLINAGFNSPELLAWGLFSKMSGYLVTRDVEAPGVTRWLASAAARDRYSRWQLLRALGAEIGRLHRAGIVHGDLRTSNVLVSQQANEFIFYFIDNERNSSHGKVPLSLVRKNLVQLNMLRPEDLSRSDRMRFARSYLHEYGRFDPIQSRDLLRRVAARTVERQRGKGWV